MDRALILKNVDIFDGESGDLLRSKVLILSEGKIEGIRDNIENCDKADVLDLHGHTITPGFIDCHMHMLLDEVPDKETQLTTSTPGGERYSNANASVAYLGAYNCRKMLAAGFTTVVDGGGSHFIECALKEAINNGYIDGPNYYIAGKQITTNPAHFIGFSVEPYGPYGMRKAVRDMLWWGVDHIKMQLSPPIRMIGRNSQACDFTMEEIEAAVDEAHNYGVSIHAHLRGATSIKRFLCAGGDLVVHGTGIDDEGVELMLKQGKFLLPTLPSPSPELAPEVLATKKKAVIDLLHDTAELHWSSAQKAYKAGVKIALSTDAGVLGIRIGTNAVEFLNLKKIGMSNLEALRAGTSEAAVAIGKQDEIGKIAPGLKADIAVLSHNPLEDLSATGRVAMTIKSGKIVNSAVDFMKFC